VAILPAGAGDGMDQRVVSLESLEDLRAELIDAQRVAADEDGKVLVWVGALLVSSFKFQVSSSNRKSLAVRVPTFCRFHRLKGV
jgi:hypothetical protein